MCSSDLQIAAQHHARHGAFKEANQGVKARQRPFFVEITEGEDLAEQAHEGHQLQCRQVGDREIEADAQIQIGGMEPGNLQILGTLGQNLTQDQAPVQHGHQGDQQVQIGRWARSIALDPAAGPGKRQQHAAEPVEGNHPDELDRQGQGMGQGDGERENRLNGSVGGGL